MPFLRSRFPSLYRFAAFLALLAVVTPVAAGIVHHPAAVQSFIHICGIDHPGDADHDKAPAHKLPSCPICQSLHLLSGGFVPPASPVIALVPPPATVLVAASEILAVTPALAPQARPRAPPSFV